MEVFFFFINLGNDSSLSSLLESVGGALLSFFSLLAGEGLDLVLLGVLLFEERSLGGLRDGLLEDDDEKLDKLERLL